MADEDESRRKRIKVSNGDSGSESLTAPVQGLVGATADAGSPAPDAQAVKEAEVGITQFVSPDLPGFSGVVKKRYTDFLVNEILPSGEVLHLKDMELSTALKTAIAETATPVESASATPQDTPVIAEEIEGKTGEAEDDKTEKPVAETADFVLADLATEDRELLDQLFGLETTPKLLNLYSRSVTKASSRPGELGKVKSLVITDKDQRTSLHQAIRRIFKSNLDSTTDSDGTIVVSAASVQQRGGGKGKRKKQSGRDRGQGASQLPRGKLGWSELGGDYLHFTLYKENKDTMEVISFLSRQLKVAPKAFQFAGTKDRRGATAQRVSVFRIYPDRMPKLNASLRMAAIGDYEYQKQGLELGELNGNEFVITLRDCQFPEGVVENGNISSPETIAKVTELVGKSLRDLRERGYFNYYGLQRFGTFATRTDTTGLKMLRGEFKEACESILHYSPIALAAAQDVSSGDQEAQRPQISTDDILRAKAIHIFQTTGNGRDALEVLPRKFTAESNIIRLLCQRKNDYFGALQSIPRNLRLMYVHAYQSLVWNFAAGERWRLYGDKVVEGDLVLVSEFKDETKATGQQAEVDADGEEIVLPDADDSAAVDDMFERARALTAEEAASGRYSIFDIVLPLPGFDILYPANKMTDFYKEFMGSEKGGKLDPFDMRRSWRDISLSGSYRKMLSRPGADYSFEVKPYRAEDEQFVKTDLERLKENASKSGDGSNDNNQPSAAPEALEQPEKIAVILKFQLGASQYATMALRELMKTGGAKEYKPDFAR
ncbi:Pseudouridine synthase, TruD [Trichophyton interdigitale]|uniref:Pseudouridine synthase, TruD n=1 Tax=Trichophyton interdigitale TaxID=101480 RepID=A0A9P4YHI5_9EURO|nr:Pseudouridine synthase, TruD [Trichophyton interdigitale]KAF3893433.1 Pseudouridine synthase, TruD [Trichophyton interdigitale]KAG8208047.1 Pseudouridine synthase, TruD [Trichophyton interdigitale]